VIDLTALRNYRSSKEIALATTLGVRDSRDLVILAVGGAYLQVVAQAAQIDSAQAQLQTARAVYQQAVEQNRAGVNARIDVNRSLVEMQTQQLRLISLETDLATQKLSLARLIGMPTGQVFTLTTPMEYHPMPPPDLEGALQRAIESRADLQAAEAQVRAAKQARKAAEAQRTPAVTISGDYLLAGVNPGQSNGTFAAFANIDVPIWRGGRIQSDIAQADAVLAQRRAEYDDLAGRIDFEVRNAFLRLTAATQQIAVAESNRGLARETLQQARDRFSAGVADTVEVVQAQESVATAEQDYISGLYSHYLARLSLARATGDAEQGIRDISPPGRP
jgi:outer membrane protein TolC